MKIAAISDIHGNIAALEAVLADIENRQVDQVVNLGDILSGALYPNETAHLLMGLSLPTIRGNHERQVLTYDDAKMGLSDKHAAISISRLQRDWLKSLPERLHLNDDVLMVHGTPDSDLEYFLETVTVDGVRPASLDEVINRAGPKVSNVILCGHTHIPRVVNLPDGRLIVNPGSVGLPAYDDIHPYPHVIETGTPHARYATIERVEGQWSAELIKVEYDWDKAAIQSEKNNRMDWARALRTGCV